MANTKKTATKATKPQTEISTPKKEGPSTEELYAIINSLQQQIQAMQSANNIPNQSSTDKILEQWANRKSEREVSIYHNCEMLGGLSTHLELSNLTIDFHTLGEERSLSWQQFEEVSSKYRSFFDRNIIMLSDGQEELAERYGLSMHKGTKDHAITRKELLKLNTLSMGDLETFFNSLSKEDKEFVCSYWLGKAYERAEGFYDRHKIEILNGLSGVHAFDNLLAYMNGDFTRDQK